MLFFSSDPHGCAASDATNPESCSTWRSSNPVPGTSTELYSHSKWGAVHGNSNQTTNPGIREREGRGGREREEGEREGREREGGGGGLEPGSGTEFYSHSKWGAIHGYRNQTTDTGIMRERDGEGLGENQAQAQSSIVTVNGVQYMATAIKPQTQV